MRHGRLSVLLKVTAAPAQLEWDLRKCGSVAPFDKHRKCFSLSLPSTRKIFDRQTKFLLCILFLENYFLLILRHCGQRFAFCNILCLPRLAGNLAEQTTLTAYLLYSRLFLPPSSDSLVLCDSFCAGAVAEVHHYANCPKVNLYVCKLVAVLAPQALRLNCVERPVRRITRSHCIKKNK